MIYDCSAPCVACGKWHVWLADKAGGACFLKQKLLSIHLISILLGLLAFVVLAGVECTRVSIDAY